ncbi:MAG: hypothetical protein KDE63_02760 [Novosphingobium sp.]|nr:hypothetical protein [Novosphingobium sp.]
MATAKKPSGAKKRSGRRKWSLRAALVVGLVLVAAIVAVVYGRPIQREAALAAAYSARVGCSCRFVSGRPLGECRAALDVEDGSSFVMLSEDEDDRSVTARVPVLASDRATYRPGWGCILDRYND